MNAGYVAWKLGPAAGSTNMAREILSGLLASRVPLKVFSCSSCKLSLTGEATHSGLTCFQLPRRDQTARGFPIWNAWASAKWAIHRTVDFQRRSRLVRSTSDLLIVNGFGSDFVWKFFNVTRPSKSVLIVHDNPARHELPGEPSLSWAVELMSKYTHLIFVSSRVRDKWLASSHLAEKQSCAIPNCCREDSVARVLALDRAQVRRCLHLPSDAFVVVCVAAIQYLKGHDLLLACLSRLYATAPKTLLVLVGAPGGMAGESWGDRFLKQINTPEHQLKIRSVGFRTDALEYIYAADVLVLPSRCEAMPITILEAMALGTPVVASDVGGIPEMIEPEKEGLLFPSGDASRLAECLTRLADNPALRCELASNARSKYWSNFSSRHLRARYGDALARLVRGQSWTS